MTEATTAVAGEYLWAMRFPLLAVAAFCLLKAGLNAHRAFFLWRHKDVRLDPVIEEAMKDVKTPRYGLMALGWLLCTCMFIYGAFAAIA